MRLFSARRCQTRHDGKPRATAQPPLTDRNRPHRRINSACGMDGRTERSFQHKLLVYSRMAAASAAAALRRAQPTWRGVRCKLHDLHGAHGPGDQRPARGGPGSGRTPSHHRGAAAGEGDG